MCDERGSEPRSSLARMFGLVDDDGPTWHRHEYAMILEHLLNSAAALLQRGGERDAMPGAGPRERVRDRLLSTAPNVEQLNILRKWAKQQRSAPDGAIPAPVASAIYFAAIAAAWKASGTRISTLTDERVRRGFEWCLAQDWVPGELAALFGAALQTWPADGPAPAG